VGKWVLYHSHSVLTLMHQNLIDGTTHNCGPLRADTPKLMILKWIVDQGQAQPGDVISFPGGEVLAVGKEARA
jgi:hypothetical protein